MHQPAGRIVDEHQQGALRPAILEPPVLAAVDLDQFADALAPRARLMNPLLPLLAIKPQPVGDHPLPQGLAGDRKTALGGELLGSQGRAEIGIVVAHDPQCRCTHRRCRPAVARPAALLRNQTRDTVTAKRLQQPPYLALAAPQQLRCRAHRQTTSIDVPEHLETPQLAIAHAQHRHRCRPPQPAKKPGRLTFLNWTALTFARCAYIASRQINGLQRPFVNAAPWANRLANVGRKARRLPSPCATERTVGASAR